MGIIQRIDKVSSTTVNIVGRTDCVHMHVTCFCLFCFVCLFVLFVLFVLYAP